MTNKWNAIGRTCDRRLPFCAHISRILTFVVLSEVFLSNLVRAQDAENVPIESRSDFGAFRDTRNLMAEAKKEIDNRQYLSAVRLLQSILDRTEDVPFPVTQVEPSSPNEPRSDQIESQSPETLSESLPSLDGLKAAALDQLLKLPADGLAAYEIEYGTEARAQ
ncbi:MAG: hypothetical protein FJ267_13100, partial [Planctomycetes bacterium]|nr:hypothetical protein [Planctomycetota bacterium]